MIFVNIKNQTPGILDAFLNLVYYHGLGPIILLLWVKGKGNKK